MVNYSILLVYDPVLTGLDTIHTPSKKFNALNVVLPWHRFREAELLAARLGSSFHSSTQTRNAQQMPGWLIPTEPIKIREDMQSR